MKKMVIATIVMLVIFVAAFAGQAQAKEPKEQTITFKIEKATYSAVDSVFYVYTEKDAEGGFWTMGFTPRKDETLEKFKKRSVGNYLIVKYIGNLNTDEGIELTGKYIYKK